MGKSKMMYVPWQYVYDWQCTACGKCCKLYSVVLNFQEWLRIVRNYGADKTSAGLNKLYIKRRSDGSCVFLHNFSKLHFCGLQWMKPKACKLWPFKILSKPNFGYAAEALYHYGGNKLYIYADSTCSGLIYGRPTGEFANSTLKEFVNIALGTQREQYKTTAKINILQF